MSTFAATAFGKVIRERRLALNMSQMELAAAAGLHINAVGYIERGERSASLDTLILLAKALRVSAAQLTTDLERELSGGRTK